MASSIQTIPARTGTAITLASKQTLRIINKHGTQVVDFFAFSVSPSNKIITQLSTQHTRCTLNKLTPEVGDGIYNSDREKMFTVVEDTTSRGVEGAGGHDILISACDERRYEELGWKGSGKEGERHGSCAQNLEDALISVGIKPPQFTPSPFNIFMNVPVHSDLQTISVEIPSSKEGDYISLRTEMDVVVVMSACPNDMTNTNGGRIENAYYQIL